MRTCIINLGFINTYSVIVDKQLVMHKVITSYSDIIKLLYKQNIDCLKILCQGTPVHTKTNDSFKLSNLSLSGNDFPVVIKDKDELFLVEMANLLFIDNVQIYSYTDYVANKFKDDGDLIVIAPYLSEYAVFHIAEGSIDNFAKVSLVNLPRKIGNYKDLYHCPVVNIFNKIDMIGIGSIVRNYKLLKEDILWSLDFLPYLYNNDGLDLVANSHDLDFVKDLSADSNETPRDDVEVPKEDLDLPVEELEEDVMSPPRKGRPDDEDQEMVGSLTNDQLEKILESSEADEEVQKFNPNEGVKDFTLDDFDDHSNKLGFKISDSIVTFFIVIILILGITGIVTSIIYSNKISKLSENLTILENKQESSNDVQEYLEGDVEKSPFRQTYLCYNQFKDLKISDCGYSDGNLTLTLLTVDDTEVSSNEEEIKKYYNIRDKGYLGKYQINGIEYSKTKYILSTR